jgi:hypothetical protein
MQLAALPIVKKKPAAATLIATPTFALMFHRADEEETEGRSDVFCRRESWQRALEPLLFYGA